MKRSLYLGKMFGIKLFVHWTFLILIAWVVFGSLASHEGLAQTFYSLLFIIMVFVCVTLHELGHAVVAKRYKCITRDITLLPIGGMARMDEIPSNPGQELAIAIAGPLVNIVIALLILPFILWMGHIQNMVTLLFNPWDNLLFTLFTVNIYLAVFNLIPAFPMDGGRVFRAILSMFTNRIKATLIAARAGQGIAVIFLLVGFFYNPILAVIGIFIFLMAQAENAHVQGQEVLKHYKVKDLLVDHYLQLNSDDYLEQAAYQLMHSQAKSAVVVHDGEVIGTTDLDNILAEMEKGEHLRLTEATYKDTIILNPEMGLDQVLYRFTAGHSPICLVKKDDTFIGIFDPASVTDFLRLESLRLKNHDTITGKNPVLASRMKAGRYDVA